MVVELVEGKEWGQTFIKNVRYINPMSTYNIQSKRKCCHSNTCLTVGIRSVYALKSARLTERKRIVYITGK